jgi:hypothetical protein
MSVCRLAGQAVAVLQETTLYNNVEALSVPVRMASGWAGRVERKVWYVCYYDSKVTLHELSLRLNLLICSGLIY